MPNYRPSKESKIREEKEGALNVLYNMRNSPTFLALIKYLEIELEISKDQILDATEEEMASAVGGARKLRTVLQSLRNPRRPS